MRIIVLCISLILLSCKTQPKSCTGTNIDYFKSSNEVYQIKYNPKYYLMVDSVGGIHILKTCDSKNKKVYRIERLDDIKKLN